MIRYVEEKYGKDHVCQIITKVNMGAKQAPRSSASALGFNYETGDILAKMIPDELGITIKEAIETNPELKNEYENNSISKTILDTAMAFEGLPKEVSTHAAGVVIAPHPLVGNIPLWMNRPTTGKNALVCQMTMAWLEKLGYLKMDFLGLSALTVIGDTVDAVKANKDIDIDYQWLMEGGADEDPKVYELMSRGDTEGLFQLEGAGMTKAGMDMKPENFGDVTAWISLYRPGPMENIPQYIKNKKNQDSIKVPFKELGPILGDTYGVLTYQEQIIFMVQAIAGYSEVDADSMRKAVGKKDEHLIAIHRELFVNGLNEFGVKVIAGGVAKYLKGELESYYDDIIVPFGKYCFNKSHGASYARIAIIDAYLKAHYPVEFMAASIRAMFNKSMTPAKLTNMKNRYFGYCKSNGIEIIHPNVNVSMSEIYATKDGEISYGLRDIKDVGKAAECLVAERNANGEFKDAADFFNRVYATKGIGRKAIEALIKVGALSCFNIKRSEALACHDEYNKVIKRRKNRKTELPLLGLEAVPSLKEFSIEVILRAEKTYAGTYLSGHPLEAYKSSMNSTNSERLQNIERLEADEDDPNSEAIEDRRLQSFHGKRYEGIVLITGITEVLTKKNRDLMAFLDIDDTTGTSRVVVFSKTYLRLKEMLEPGLVIHIKGKFDLYQGEISIQPDVLKPYRTEEMLPPIYLSSSMGNINEICKDILKSPGKHPVILKCRGFSLPTCNDYWVSTTGAQKLIEKYNGYIK